MDARAQQAAAFAFLARLGSAVLPQYTGAAANPQTVHIPQAFHPTWIQGLPLPLAEEREANQTVALIDGMDFHREVDEDAVTHAYQERPRTRVYESIHVRSGGWYGLVALHLARLLRRRVVCSMYESHAIDRNLGAHDDEWFGVIVQMRGAKRWTLWPDAASAPHQILTRTGDVLLLPQGVKHEVNTPDSSLHLVFAITGTPIERSSRPATDQHAALSP